MPAIDKPFLLQLKKDYTDYDIFIETGTSHGETIFTVESLFNELYTIECSEKYYNSTKNRYHGNKINFILGDSSIVFTTLLPTITKKCIFFLDGHYSSLDTGRGEKDVPLLEEIISINSLFTSEAILIIDDVRLFGTKNNEDWSDISKSKILDILKDRISELYHLDSVCCKGDRLIIHINQL